MLLLWAHGYKHRYPPSNQRAFSLKNWLVRFSHVSSLNGKRNQMVAFPVTPTLYSPKGFRHKTGIPKDPLVCLPQREGRYCSFLFISCRGASFEHVLCLGFCIFSSLRMALNMARMIVGSIPL